MSNEKNVRIMKRIISCILILTTVVGICGFEIAYAEKKPQEESLQTGEKNYINQLEPQEPIMQVGSSINNNDETYEEYMPYDKEILKEYEKFSETIMEKNHIVHICLEDFADYYKEGNEDNCYRINDEIEVRLEKNIEKRNRIIESNKNVSKIVEESKSAQSGGSSTKHYYNIGTDPNYKPSYSSTSSILQVAQKGDVVLDKEGSLGKKGHAAIVEGKFWSSKQKCYYIRLIEAIDQGVTYGLLDDIRALERDSVLYKVFVATDDKKAKAVEFCKDQIGDGWWPVLSHDYDGDQVVWLCSQLVWAGYRNQGIDIECSGGGDNGVMPKDITVNSEKTTKVDIKADFHPIKDGTYYITNCKSNLRLDVNGNIADSTQIQQYGVGNYSDQKWIINYNTTGRYYTIRTAASTSSNFYLDVASPSSGAHAKVKLWHTNSNIEEKWYIQKVSDNKYCFINCYNGLRMDIKGGSVNSGADVQVYRYTGTEDQKWRISLCGTKVISNGVYYITNNKSNLRLDVDGSSAGKSKQIKQSTVSNKNSQKWFIEWDDSWSCYYLVNGDLTNGAFYLDVASPSSGSNAKVKLWNVKTRPEERWVIVACGNGTYKFINGYDNLCMDIQGGSTVNGADVQVYPYEGTADQKWKIQKT